MNLQLRNMIRSEAEKAIKRTLKELLTICINFSFKWINWYFKAWKWHWIRYPILQLHKRGKYLENVSSADSHKITILWPSAALQPGLCLASFTMTSIVFLFNINIYFFFFYWTFSIIFSADFAYSQPSWNNVFLLLSIISLLWDVMNLYWKLNRFKTHCLKWFNF